MVFFFAGGAGVLLLLLVVLLAGNVVVEITIGPGVLVELPGLRGGVDTVGRSFFSLPLIFLAGDLAGEGNLPLPPAADGDGGTLPKAAEGFLFLFAGPWPDVLSLEGTKVNSPGEWISWLPITVSCPIVAFVRSAKMPCDLSGSFSTSSSGSSASKATSAWVISFFSLSYWACRASLGFLLISFSNQNKVLFKLTLPSST